MYNNVMHEVCVPWAMLMLIKRKRKHYKQTERGENVDFSEEEEAQGVRLLQRMEQRRKACVSFGTLLLELFEFSIPSENYKMEGRRRSGRE